MLFCFEIGVTRRPPEMSTQAQFIANGKSLLQSAGTTLRYLGAQVEHAVSRKWGFLRAEITSSWHLAQQL